MENLAGYLGLYKAAQEAVSQAARLNRLDLDKLQVNGRSMGLVIGELAGQLAQVKAALEARDLVLLNDLLTYELTRGTEQWQELLSALDQRLAQDPVAE